MPLRYLFGPVNTDFADQCLGPPRKAGRCLAFDTVAGPDLTISPDDTWQSVCARLPDGWRPDFLAVQLAHTTVPPSLVSAPIPLVGLAGHWDLLWHYYRRRLPGCDLVFADPVGADLLARDGLLHVVPANLCGCRLDYAEGSWPDVARDIDVLFVGELQDAITRERLPWLARLVELAERWRVVIRTATWGEAYRALLARARVVFNFSTRRGCNARAFEAAAAGALLFQEADNREVGAYFEDRREYVAYTADDLLPLLEHYLSHEGERRAVAGAARLKVRGYCYADLWERAAGEVERRWARLEQQAAARLGRTGGDDLLTRAWQALGSAAWGDTPLVQDLTEVARAPTAGAELHSALGLAVARRTGGRPEAAAEAAEHFRTALAHTPDDVLAALNLAEALAASGQSSAAVGEATRALEVLDRLNALPPSVLGGMHYPPSYDFFRVEWERAAWAHAGDRPAEAKAKRNLLIWRLHGLLAKETGLLAHRYEAALARPDLPATRAALASALVRGGRPAEARRHLRRAVADNPFDRGAARALFDLLGTAGRAEEQCQFMHTRRLLSRAAPQVVPSEPWFEVVPEQNGLACGIYEQILPSIQRTGGVVRGTPIVVRQEGCEDPGRHRAELERTHRLLLMEHRERPEDPFVLFNLGSLYLDMGRPVEAAPFLELSIAQMPPGCSFDCKQHVLLISAFRRIQCTSEALRVCRAGLMRLPRQPELLFYEGLLMQETGDLSAAEARFRELLTKSVAPNQTGTDQGLTGYKTRHNLAILLCDQRRWAEAEAEWRLALEECAAFIPAWLGLADLFVAQDRWTDLEETVQRLNRQRSGHSTGELLRARMHMGRKEYDAAIAILEKGAASSAQALWPRLLLSEARWNQGTDPAATQRALRDVLAIDPNHRHSLQRLARIV